MGFVMTQDVRGTTVYLNLSGEIDLNATPEILGSMKAAFKRAEEGVVLDLDQVSHIDSSGIAAMVEGVRDSKKSGKQFRLSRVPENVNGILKLARLHDFFQYED